MDSLKLILSDPKIDAAIISAGSSTPATEATLNYYYLQYGWDVIQAAKPLGSK